MDGYFDFTPGIDVTTVEQSSIADRKITVSHYIYDTEMIQVNLPGPSRTQSTINELEVK